MYAGMNQGLYAGQNTMRQVIADEDVRRMYIQPVDQYVDDRIRQATQTIYPT
jgi:hypothetical protein